MKLDVLSSEELINIIREKVPELDEELVVYEILKNREKALHEKLKAAEKRRDETREWFYSFLKDFPFKERIKGRKEYYVPPGIWKQNEEKIKEYQEADSAWWEADKAHWKAWQDQQKAFEDKFMSKYDFDSLKDIFKENPFERFEGIFESILKQK